MANHRHFVVLLVNGSLYRSLQMPMDGGLNGGVVVIRQRYFHLYCLWMFLIIRSMSSIFDKEMWSKFFWKTKNAELPAGHHVTDCGIIYACYC